jgi:hypothetical protein
MDIGHVSFLGWERNRRGDSEPVTWEIQQNLDVGGQRMEFIADSVKERPHICIPFATSLAELQLSFSAGLPFSR